MSETVPPPPTDGPGEPTAPLRGVARVRQILETEGPTPPATPTHGRRLIAIARRMLQWYPPEHESPSPTAGR